MRVNPEFQIYGRRNHDSYVHFLVRFAGNLVAHSLLKFSSLFLRVAVQEIWWELVNSGS